ncbi:MAG: sigma 54-interacting transcriptional regulator [Myxococcales bacterium]|nr:sigma 54-interacting transcriptional regulator [Myxococcales bacterium]
MTRSRGGRPDEPATRSLAVAKGRPRLVVIAGASPSTHVIPASGVVVIGRDPGCNVRIDDPSLSRRHARFQVTDRLTVEDLGSSNGTTVRGERIAANTPREISYDEVVTVGSIGVLVQQHTPVASQRALWGHGYFELRLSEECTRAARTGTQFGLLRVRTRDGGGGAAVERLVASVRDVDVIGTYAPGEWEVLLVDAGADEVAAISRAVGAAIPEASVAAVRFPADGHDAWALSTAIASRLDGARPDAEAAPGEAVLSAMGPMRPLLALIEKVALGEISVLILGETGVGKELIAEEVHRRSPRARHPLVKLNCAALPEQLLESELFGHERGAFTGAVASKTGLLEEADGGSVFLDEIGELPAATQAKLLRVIEQREILRVGAVKSKKIDVRFIAATHRDLDDAIAAGRFREDLYFRLAGVSLQVPPLRERMGELDALVTRFAARTAAGLGRSAPSVSAAARALLHAYRWPGNVRELRNVVERATLLCEGVIDAHHLPEDRMQRPAVASPSSGAPGAGGLDGVRVQAEALERQAIIDALAQTHGNQTEAAKLLGVSRRTLTNKLNQFGLDRPRKRT